MRYKAILRTRCGCEQVLHEVEDDVPTRVVHMLQTLEELSPIPHNPNVRAAGPIRERVFELRGRSYDPIEHREVLYYLEAWR